MKAGAVAAARANHHVSQLEQGVDERCAGGPGQSYVAGFDGGQCLDGDIDQPPLLVRKSTQTILHGPRLLGDGSPMVAHMGGDRVSDGVVQATVEGTKLVYIDGLAFSRASSVTAWQTSP